MRTENGAPHQERIKMWAEMPVFRGQAWPSVPAGSRIQGVMGAQAVVRGEEE